MKALLPVVESLMGGRPTSRRLVLAERGDRRLGRSATRARGPKNGGAGPCDVVLEATALPGGSFSAYMCLALALFLGLASVSTLAHRLSLASGPCSAKLGALAGGESIGLSTE